MSENTTPTVVSVTQYAAAKIVNALLQRDGIDKVVPPQMMYNYTTARIRKDKTPFIAVDDEGKILLDSLEEWYAKYVVKLQNKEDVDSVVEAALAQLS